MPVLLRPPYWGGRGWGRAAAGPPGDRAAGPATTGNIYSAVGLDARRSRARSGGYNAWTGNAWATQVGASYNSRTGIASAGQRGAVGNVYTGNYAAGARGVATGRTAARSR